MPFPAHRPSRLSALYCALIAASFVCLSSLQAADDAGYLRRSGPSPIRFQPASLVTSPHPLPDSLLSTHSPVPRSNAPDQPSITSSPLPATNLPIPSTHPAESTHTLTAPPSGIPNHTANPNDIPLPIAGPASAEFTAESAPLIEAPPHGLPAQSISDNPVALIEPQTILPLLLEDATLNSARVTVVTPLSFTPPQPNPGIRSKATYSLIP